jgi:phytoene desaturase
MYSITTSITQLALDLGVKFNFNCSVDEIIHTDKSITGIRLKDEIIEADIVVSNLDIYPTYHKLLPKLSKPNLVLNQQRSSSALIFYWGIRKSFPQLGLHNILFSADYKDEFNHLFKKGTISDDPTLYINISSKYKTDDAPEGHENWFMMINVPNHNSAMDWDKMINEARTNIIKKASLMLGEEISELITVESILEPRTIESRTGSYQGSLYGNSSNGPMAAFFRHNNRHPKVKGLYFVGGSVHPGGGIPLALSSARIVGEMVVGDNS